VIYSKKIKNFIALTRGDSTPHSNKVGQGTSKQRESDAEFPIRKPKPQHPENPQQPNP
jgi:hypothetical protein